MGFAIAAFVILGIERFLYGYIYNFPKSFKALCDNGALRILLDRAKGLYWQVAQDLGVYIKVFQFGVIGYDLLLRRSVGLAPLPLIVVGAVLAGIGQMLNVTTFNAIGGVGVYYGSQLGYEVPWCHGFPYNLPFYDPQYWGVVIFVWGVYICLAPDYGALFSISGHFLVAWYETFWYIASMKLLEHGDHATAALALVGAKPQSSK